jgi:hypothetical protein
MQPLGYSKSPNATEDLPSVALTSWRQPKCTIEILTAKDILLCCPNIERVKLPKQGTAKDRRIEISGVNFSPFITHKGSIRFLKGCTICIAILASRNTCCTSSESITSGYIQTAV